MESITAEEILKKISGFEEDLLIKPRKQVAELLGANEEQIESVTANTMFIISGQHRDGLPNFVRFSVILEKNTFLMMDDPRFNSGQNYNFKLGDL